MSNEIREYFKQDLCAVKTAYNNEEIDLNTAIKQCGELLDLDLSGLTVTSMNRKILVENYLKGQL